ncbi:DUF4136 domain-containing protein [Terriglobus sp.]|uniref:DUF4136 domain-containing protein n=1 Tax=Terriglobus sp. TaxID=1889013 RepID=UPI003B00FE94
MKSTTQRFAAAALGTIVAFGSASLVHAQKVYTDYDHNANFAQYHTFSIYRVHASDQLMEGRIRSNIEASLRDHGWQEVPQGGDVAVTAVGNVKNTQEYTTFYNDLGPGWGYGGWGGRYGWGGWGGRGWGGFGGFGGDGVATTRSELVPVGTLAVDLYDSRTHQLIFRGTATDELSTKHADKNARKGAKAVDKIFYKLPNARHAG